jgi:hypothetical protein
MLRYVDLVVIIEVAIEVCCCFYKCTATFQTHRIYEGLRKIFQTDTVKIIKLTIRPNGCHHPQSSSLPHVNTSPVSSTF